MDATWTKDQIAERLQADDRWVVRGMLAIYKRQTEDEKIAMTTSHHNTVGFSGCDAEIMSSFSQQVLRGRTLSEKQMVIARRKMAKYAGQLAKVAAEKADTGCMVLDAGSMEYMPEINTYVVEASQLRVAPGGTMTSMVNLVDGGTVRTFVYVGADMTGDEVDGFSFWHADTKAYIKVLND